MSFRSKKIIQPVKKRRNKDNIHWLDLKEKGGKGKRELKRGIKKKNENEKNKNKALKQNKKKP